MSIVCTCSEYLLPMSVIFRKWVWGWCLTWCLISGLYILCNWEEVVMPLKKMVKRMLLCSVAVFSSESSNYLLSRKCKKDSGSVCSWGSGCGQLQGWQCFPCWHEQYKKVKVHPLLFHFCSLITHAAEIEHNGEIAMCFFGFVDFPWLSHIKSVEVGQRSNSFFTTSLFVFKISAIWHKTDDMCCWRLLMRGPNSGSEILF